MGCNTTAKSYSETTIGRYNTDYTPNSATLWNASDRLFVIGNGTGTGANQSNALVVLKNGNTGIGFSTPTNKLEVNGTLKVGAYVLPSTDGTNGQILKTDGSGALSWSDDNNVSLWTENSGNVYRSSGNVGIGTTSPAQKLEVDGNILQTDGDYTATDQIRAIDGDGLKLYDDGGNGIFIEDGGQVGIGSTSPSCPLEINGSGSLTASFGYLNSSGNVGTTGTQANDYSIKASDRIMASEFNAVSDQRVKTRFSISDNAMDLQRINQLEVTNYSYIDTVAKGSDMRLGFIAQQVETIFPQAVNTSSQFIPNIYKLSQKVIYDSLGNTQSIAMSAAHNLKKGDLIKLYDADKMHKCTVIEVVSPTEFKIESINKNNSQVFVFGKKADDFRAVDYDRIFVLGISAIQELSKELELLKAENKNLKANDANIEARLDRIESIINTQSQTMK